MGKEFYQYIRLSGEEHAELIAEHSGKTGGRNMQAECESGQ